MLSRNIGFGLLCALMLAGLSVSLLAGCATSPATRFYTLNAAKDENVSQVFTTPKYSIVIGQATVPDTVNRAEIVTRRGSNQVRIHENHRWAESLKTEIPRVVALNIATLIPDAQVAAYPQRLALDDADFDVILDVQVFDAIPDQAVVLAVQWRVQNRADGNDGNHGKQAITRHTHLTEHVDSDDMAAIATAFSRALAVLSKEIATAVQSAVQSENFGKSDS